MSEWKYFPEVGDRMDTSFMQRLTELRELINIPLNVTSSFRSPDHNIRAGGTVNSAHLLGRAVDIRIAGKEAYRLVSLAIQFGFTGIGVRQKGEFNKRIIHLDDCSDCPERPRPRIWSY